MILFDDSSWKYTFIILMTVIFVGCGIYTTLKILKEKKKENELFNDLPKTKNDDQNDLALEKFLENDNNNLNNNVVEQENNDLVNSNIIIETNIDDIVANEEKEEKSINTINVFEYVKNTNNEALNNKDTNDENHIILDEDSIIKKKDEVE